MLRFFCLYRSIFIYNFLLFSYTFSRINKQIGRLTLPTATYIVKYSFVILILFLLYIILCQSFTIISISSMQNNFD